MARKKKNNSVGIDNASSAEAYKHPTAESLLRPEVGTQPQFKKKKPPKSYRYDSSLSPELCWDNNPIREVADKFIASVLNATSLDEAKQAAQNLKAISKPFLNWTGKAERLSFDVPTLPLFIHERLSTKAIIESIRDRKRQPTLFDLFHQRVSRPATEQVLRAYEHNDKWVNRLILGDSLLVMNSLLEYEGMAGKVQTVFIDPPYGISYGSNFQPFIKKRDVTHGSDEDLTREPEMVQAYRDTWTMGVHSYLSYIRDRLLLSRELLSQSGSVFIQISDENLHLVKSVLDEVFGFDNFCALIPFRKKTWPMGARVLEQMYDYIVWYAKEKDSSNGKLNVKYNKLFLQKNTEPDNDWSWYELPDGSRHKMNKGQVAGSERLPPGARIYRLRSLEPSGPNPSGMFDFELDGRPAKHPKRGWATDREGMERLRDRKRLQFKGNLLNFVWFQDDFPLTDLTTPWTDTVGASDKSYVVQTNPEVIKRCILMSSNPGDLILDPTCGSGTTAVVAEHWGRRWITIDTSRVPVALARQRLLTEAYPYFELKDEKSGPGAGFVYLRKQNKAGQEVGGIVPHITPKSIAKDSPPEEEVRLDNPALISSITRVTGPFVFEATIPAPMESLQSEASNTSQHSLVETFTDRLLAILTQSPILRLPGNKEIKLKDVRRPTKSLALSAEAISINGKDRKVAFLFGPENGAISHGSVYAAIQEAQLKNYDQFVALGFSIEPNARITIDQCEQAIGIPALYVQVTPDVMMNDLLKTMRSSQIFSVCGLPEIDVAKIVEGNGTTSFSVRLVGLDIFDPSTMETVHCKANDVPAWFLDTDYNGLVFHIDQAFFPKTGAWENLQKSLKGTYDESIWDHLAGTKSAPFEAGEHKQIAVKVIDERGNELIVTKFLGEVKS